MLTPQMILLVYVTVGFFWSLIYFFQAFHLAGQLPKNSNALAWVVLIGVLTGPLLIPASLIAWTLLNDDQKRDQNDGGDKNHDHPAGPPPASPRERLAVTPFPIPTTKGDLPVDST